MSGRGTLPRVGAVASSGSRRGESAAWPGAVVTVVGCPAGRPVGGRPVQRRLARVRPVGRDRRIEGGVLGQHRRLEPAQLGARLDAQLVDEVTAGILECPQRIRLAAGERRLGEPGALGACPPVGRQARQGLAADERERAAQVDDRGTRVVTEVLSGARHHLVEALEVGAGAVAGHEGVPGVGGLDDRTVHDGRQAAAQARHQHLQRVGGLPGWPVAVEDVDEAIRRHDLAAFHGQGCQQQLQLLTGNGHDRPVVACDVDGPEQTDLHGLPRYRRDR